MARTCTTVATGRVVATTSDSLSPSMGTASTKWTGASCTSSLRPVRLKRMGARKGPPVLPLGPRPPPSAPRPARGGRPPLLRRGGPAPALCRSGPGGPLLLLGLGRALALGAPHAPNVLHLPPALAAFTAALLILGRVKHQEHLAFIRHQARGVHLAYGFLQQAQAEGRAGELGLP